MANGLCGDMIGIESRKTPLKIPCGKTPLNAVQAHPMPLQFTEMYESWTQDLVDFIRHTL